MEHTLNMSSMVVTPEVFQLEMSALKFCMPEKSPPMSETAETSQSAMRPYVAVAAAGSTLYAWTATFREAVLVKMPGGDDGGDGGDGGGGGSDGGGGGGSGGGGGDDGGGRGGGDRGGGGGGGHGRGRGAVRERLPAR